MPEPLPTPSPVAKVTLIHNLDATTALGSSTTFAMSGSVPDTATLGLIGEAVVAVWIDTLAAVYSEDGTLAAVKVKDLSQPDVLPGEAITDSAGTRSGALPTLGVCAVISRKPGRSYRGSRPKSFLPYGVTSDIVTGNVWSSSFITSMQDAWAAYIDGIAGTSVDGTNLGAEVCVSYYGHPTIENPNPRARNRFVSTLRDPPLVTPSIGFLLSPTLGSQRRRLKAV